MTSLIARSPSLGGQAGKRCKKMNKVCRKHEHFEQGAAHAAPWSADSSSLPPRNSQALTGAARCTIKAISLMLMAAFSFVPLYWAKAESCGFDVLPPLPELVVFENEPFARIWLYREKDTNLVQTVDYFTVDGSPPYVLAVAPARSGVHYLARSGTATFAAGQNATSVDIPLVDNGLLDAFRDFRLVLTNPAPGLEVWPESFWIRIEDNEMGSLVDPLFVPDAPFWDDPWPFPSLAMSDGRVLVRSSGRLAMLQQNGSSDVTFATTFAASFTNAWLEPLQELNEGQILANAH